MRGDSSFDDGDGKRSKYGKSMTYDPSFNGPVEKRSCTDVICCLIFGICIVGMVGISILGFIHGDPRRIIYPTDSKGNICGYGNFSETQKLLFFDILACLQLRMKTSSFGCPTPQVCVKKCPTENYVYLESHVKELSAHKVLEKERNRLVCQYGVDRFSESIVDLVKSHKCAAYYVKSTAVAGRCVPAVFKKASTVTKTLVTMNSTRLINAEDVPITFEALEKASRYLGKLYKFKDYGELVFKDMKESWFLILVCFGLAVLISLTWIILLRWLAVVLVWITLIAYIALLVFVTYYSFSRYFGMKNGDTENKFGLPKTFTGNFNNYLTLQQTWLAFGCIAVVVLIISLLLLLFVARRLCIAIALIKEASKAVGSMMCSFLWPLVPFVLQTAVIAYWIISATFIASIGKQEHFGPVVHQRHDGITYLKRLPCNKTDKISNRTCEFVQYGENEYTIYLEVYLLFMMLWLINFVAAFNQIVLSGAFASYYWAFNKPNDIPAFPIMQSAWRAFRYHLGSLAFGSLLIAIVQLMRVFLEYIDHKLQEADNKVAVFVIKCLKCCLWCLEKFLKFLNKNAYIMISIHGKNFCKSARKAFFLIMRNCLRTLVLNKVTDLLLFLSRMMVTAAVGVVAFYWAQGKIPFVPGFVVPQFNYYLAPVILIILGAYFISSCFFNVYDMAVDTIFLCFLEDLERNDGSAEKPYFMHKDLMKILGKKNKPLLHDAKD